MTYICGGVCFSYPLNIRLPRLDAHQQQRGDMFVSQVPSLISTSIGCASLPYSGATTITKLCQSNCACWAITCPPDLQNLGNPAECHQFTLTTSLSSFSQGHQGNQKPPALPLPPGSAEQGCVEATRRGDQTFTVSLATKPAGKGTTVETVSAAVVGPSRAKVLALAMVWMTQAALLSSSRVMSLMNWAEPMSFMRGTRCMPSRALTVSFSPCNTAFGFSGDH